LSVGSDSSEERSRASFVAEVQAASRLLGDAYAENADLRKQVDQLQAALDANELIAQAKGVIMGRLDIDAEAAWGLLHAGANGDVNGAQRVAAAVVAYRRTPAEIAAALRARPARRARPSAGSGPFGP
jgi:hypothetical protein